MMKNLHTTVVMVMALLLFSCTATDSENGLANFGSSLLSSLGQSSNQLTLGEINSGLKEALRVGSNNVVSQLSKTGGFNKDTSIHIPLPKELKTVQSALKAAGMSYLLDDLETKINRAAEISTPKAKALFADAISEMTIQDINGIYRGADDAATRYFEGKMSDKLAREMQPIINSSISQAGAVEAYDKVMAQYKNLPFMPDVKANLVDHVTDKGIDGIFHYIAKEEAAIRNNPAKRTTQILQKVFGAQ